ncbi:MAG: TetR/AcrR family transcriptional regulator [Spirochaetales bacterium]|nr:TetR/AcrR family transcriptional regulator [Spirochaetales bacterium]
MARITKTPEERKEEIISASRTLFLEKGYAHTKVSDIVKAIGVSQGIFYYYFSSKDAVIDEIIDRYMRLQLSEARKIVDNGSLSPLEKLEKMAEAQMQINHRENQNIHRIKGVDIHERINSRIISDYVPLMVEAYGDPGDLQVQMKFEVFVASANFLFDPGIFTWTPVQRNKRIDHIIDLMEKSIDLPAGSFRFYRTLMGYQS